MSVAVLIFWMSNHALHSCNDDITCLCRAVSLPHFCLTYILFLMRFLPYFSVWAAKTASVPVQMAVSSFGNQRGLIVTLDDSGSLSISYLGE